MRSSRYSFIEFDSIDRQIYSSTAAKAIGLDDVPMESERSLIPNENCLPDELLTLFQNVTETPLSEAVEKLQEWQKMIGTLCNRQKETTDGLWQWFWSNVDKLCSDEDPPEGAILFLLYGCPDIYAGRWHFASACPVLPRLLPLAERLTDSLNEIENLNTEAIRRVVVDSVSSCVQANANAHFGELMAVIGKTHWEFEEPMMTSAGLVKLDLRQILRQCKEVDDFEQLRQLQKYFISPYQDGFRKMVRKHLEPRWSTLRSELRGIWSSNVGNSDYDGFTKFYSLSYKDASWFEMAGKGLVDLFRNEGYSWQNKMSVFCEFLLGFKDDSEFPGRYLLDLLPSNAFDKAELTAIVLDFVWQLPIWNDSALVLALLKNEKYLHLTILKWDGCSAELLGRWEKALTRIKTREDVDLLQWLAERCLELPASYDRSMASLPMGIDERAAWRNEVSARLKKNAAVRRASFEFFLWCTSGEGVDEAELLVLGLLKTQEDRTALRNLFKHPCRTVQIRARAVNDLAEGKLLATTQVMDRNAHQTISETLSQFMGANEARMNARTWLGDPALEALIQTSIAKVERSFTEEYPSQWGNDEERLVTRLMTNLQNEFSDIKKHLRKIEVNGFVEPVDIDLTYRETTRSEEGGSGVDTKTFGTDIAFILKVQSGNICEIERATFVQCKKLKGDDVEGEWEPSLEVDPSQRDDLIRQTESSFYLFMVPAFFREECWIVPARLVRDLMSVCGRKTVIPRLFANNASRSLAQWLTYDLLGMWTGDERSEILDKAKGKHPGRRPQFMVTITIRKGKGDRQCSNR